METMTAEELRIERAQIENVFCLGGGELETEPWQFKTEDGEESSFRYWYQESPDYCERTEKKSWEWDSDGNFHETRTVIYCALYGGPDLPAGWEKVAEYRTSGEADCWHDGPGCDDSNVKARERREADRETYRTRLIEDKTPHGSPEWEKFHAWPDMCELCEDSGNVYIGDGYGEFVFRKIETDD